MTALNGKKLLWDELNVLKWMFNVKIKTPSMITDSNQARLVKMIG
jgi:hypothetical protein